MFIVCKDITFPGNITVVILLILDRISSALVLFLSIDP